MCFGLYASWNYHPAWGAQSLSCHGFRASFESLDTKLDNIHSTVASHDQRIGSLESGLTEVSQRLEHSEAACSGLCKNNESLQVKVSDLEGRSRMFTSWVFLSPSKAHVQRSSSPNFLLMFSGIRFWSRRPSWTELQACSGAETASSGSAFSSLPGEGFGYSWVLLKKAFWLIKATRFCHSQLLECPA